MASLNWAQWEGLEDDSWYSKPMVFTKNKGWQLLTSLCDASYTEATENYLKMLRENTKAEKKDLYATIKIGDQYTITPVAHQILRMGCICGAIQLNKQTTGVRLMVFGIDCDRNNDYGIGRFACSMQQDEFLDDFVKAASEKLGHSQFATLIDLA
jgi:hypothetical protein